MSSRRLTARPLAFRALFVAGVALSLIVGVLGLFPVRSQTPTLEAGHTLEAVPADDPWASIWDGTGSELVPLSAQNVTPPFGGGTIGAITARALHDGQRLFFMVEWEDADVDDSVAGVDLFSDAVALQFPIGDDGAPYTMGGAGLPVNIWQWKAVWQVDVDSGFETIQDRLSDTYVDSYQQEGNPLYRTAEEAGNILAQRDRTTPVENLVAEGWGTLTTAEVQDVQGSGVWREGRWRVLFIRDFESVEPGFASFASGGVTSVAFAVWDGHANDRDGQKSIAPFIQLRLGTETPATPGGQGFTPGTVLLAVAMAIAVAVAVLLIRRVEQMFDDSRGTGSG